MSANRTQVRVMGGGKNASKKERSSNLELYRIIVMLLIVAHHYVVNSGLLTVMADNPVSSNSLFYYIFGAWGKTGINCFVLITGYFMCNAKISIRKFLKLFLWVLLYNIIISSIFLFSGYCSEDQALSVFVNMFPMRSIMTDFSSCFLLFYLCIPFINVLIRNINKKQHFALMVLLVFLYTLHQIPGLGVSYNYVSWFFVLYIIASYLKLYPTRFDSKTSVWCYLTVLSLSLSALSIFCLLWLDTHGISFGPYIFVSDSNTLLALTNGVTSFMLFKNLKIKNSIVINTIAASSFGVLLIHANSNTMRQWLWKDVCDCVGHYDSSFYWLYAIGCVIVIYTVCTIIDFIRIKTIETPLLNAAERLCMMIYNKIITK